ncbi:MAG: thioether cross-link-forming SCIFF peptide maturase, partial [Eubacteriales bacterium]|nr:thioether cross-link-forming SCIFF peptide maturase [Eubacteriales bacterium]
VLDVNSGSIHSVDELVYDLLDYYKKENIENILEILKNKYSAEDIKEAYAEIKELEENEVLFSPDIYEGVLDQVDNRQPVVKALCLHIAHDCNLKCKYCFAEEGEYHGKRSLMSAEVGKKAIDFLIENSGKRRNLEIDFFGGEPLMNFDVVKEIVEYGRSVEKKYNKNFRFTITTNGILLTDEIADYINKNMHNAVLSLDGRKEINDKMRVRVGGQGSYDNIVPKFVKMAEDRNQMDYYVRGTFTRNNLDFAEDVLHLADLGFKQISVEPVVSDEKEDYAIKKEDLPTIYAEYEKLAKEIIKRKKEGKWFNFFHFMIDLTGGPCVAKRLVGCGSGTEYLAVAPEGDLFPCHQFVGQDKFKVGNVFNGIENKNIRKDFEKCNVYSKPACKSCWAKFYCSGGCSASSNNMHNDLITPYEIGCELQKKRTECSIMIKIDEACNVEQ